MADIPSLVDSCRDRILEPSPWRHVVLDNHEGGNMRSALLWLIGVPIPIIIILWLVTGHA
jgi:hypothetical protein